MLLGANGMVQVDVAAGQNRIARKKPPVET
jgi:hypothetical protein